MPEERSAACTVGYQGGSFMVWGCISYEAHTNIIVFDRANVDIQRYVEEVLQDHVVPFAPFIGDNFLLIHNNAHAHTARLTTEYRNKVGIQRLPWPARASTSTLSSTSGITLKDGFDHGYQHPSPSESLNLP